MLTLEQIDGMERVSYSTNPDSELVMLHELKNPSERIVADAAAEHDLPPANHGADTQAVAEKKYPGLPTLVVLESPIRRACDAACEAIDDPWDAAKSLIRIPWKLEKLLQSMSGGLVPQDEKHVRDAICKQCPDCNVAVRFLDRDRRMRLVGYFCGACSCGMHPLAELMQSKNHLRKHECPKKRHPGNALRTNTAWRFVKEQKIPCIMPAEFGCGCGVKIDEAEARVG